MKKIKIDNREVTLMGVNHYSAGAAGRYGIICYFEYAGVEFSIFTITNNMYAFTQAMDIGDYVKREIALYEMIAHKIEGKLWHKMCNIDEE